MHFQKNKKSRSISPSFFQSLRLYLPAEVQGVGLDDLAEGSLAERAAKAELVPRELPVRVQRQLVLAHGRQRCVVGTRS